MLRVRTIKKYHDAKGILLGYTIQNVDNPAEVMNVTKENLKLAISRGQAEVVNMTLTSDGRLIGKAAPAPKKKPENQRVNAFVHNVNGEDLLEIYTNGRNIVAALVNQEELAKNTWGVKTLPGWTPGIVFDIGHEAVNKASHNRYDNIKIVDGKPDLSAIKRRSFKQVKPKIIKSLSALTDLKALSISVNKGENKYEYVVVIDNYDSLVGADDSNITTAQLIFCLLEDAFVTAKIKTGYIDEDKFTVQCMTGIADVRKAVKTIFKV